MAELIYNWLDWLEASSIASAIRQSLWLYPFIEIIHIFGIVLVAGGAGLFDLHVLVNSRTKTIDQTTLHLLTWSKRGLLLVIPSGILLFITNAKALGFDPTFHLKLILILLAGLNAWLFHLRVYLPHLKSAEKILPRKNAKLNAAISLVLWMAVICCGRLLAY